MAAWAADPVDGGAVSELTSEAIQTNLFEDTGKKTQLYKAIDEVKGRYGKERSLRRVDRQVRASDRGRTERT